MSLVAHDHGVGPDPDCGECDGTGIDFVETKFSGQVVHPCLVCKPKPKAEA